MQACNDQKVKKFKKTSKTNNDEEAKQEESKFANMKGSRNQYIKEHCHFPSYPFPHHSLLFNPSTLQNHSFKRHSCPPRQSFSSLKELTPSSDKRIYVNFKKKHEIKETCKKVNDIYEENFRKLYFNENFNIQKHHPSLLHYYEQYQKHKHLASRFPFQSTMAPSFHLLMYSFWPMMLMHMASKNSKPLYSHEKVRKTIDKMGLCVYDDKEKVKIENEDDDLNTSTTSSSPMAS